MKKILLAVLLICWAFLAAEIVIDESFDSPTMPTGWTQEYESGNFSWMSYSGGYNGNPAAPHTGASNAYIFNESCITKLVTPMLNIGGSYNATLTFWHAQVEWLGYQDILKVYYKNEPDDDWSLIETYDSDITTWTQETINLPSESSSYYIAFEAVCAWGYGVVLDDVEIEGETSPVGVVSGHVYDASGIPLTGAEVLIEDVSMSALTVTGGFYRIVAIPEGNHPFFASLDGYGFDMTTATIIAGETVIVDFNLQEYVEVIVRGTVILEHDGEPVQGATINLEGFADYEGQTAANGQFIIPGVFSNNTYELSITKPNHNPYLATVDVQGADIDLGNLTLIPPINITGHVVSNLDPETGLYDADIDLAGYAYHTTDTDSLGNFTIDAVYANEDYEISIDYPNHNIYTQTIDVQQDNIDLGTITLIGPVTVYGYVYGSDDLVNGLVDADIDLVGNGNHSTTTDSTGYYEFTEVFANQEYTVNIEAENYVDYTMQIEVESVNLEVDDIIMAETTSPAGNVNAAILDELSTQISWNTPGGGNTYEFRYDDGDQDREIGIDAVGDAAVIGAVHEYYAVIEQVKWYLTNAHNHPRVKIKIFGITNNGIPDSDDILYESGLIPNVNNQWRTYNLPTPVSAPNGFFVGISTPDVWTDLGMDDGNDEPWVFQSGTQFSTINWHDNIWSDISGYPNAGNLMLRAYGMNIGPPLNRELEGYKLYRLEHDNISDPDEWEVVAENLQDTTYTDTTWWYLEEGTWHYAVRCQHTYGVESIATFSNALDKDDPPTFEADFNITAPNSNPLQYCITSLTSFYHTYNSNSDAQGLADYTVNPGVYDLHISKNGYEDYDLEDILITENLEMNIMLVSLDESDDEIIAQTSLLGIYPNPFNPETTLSFSLQKAVHTTIEVYNLKGQKIESIVDKQLPAGSHSVTWDAAQQPSGIYLIKFQADNVTQLSKAVLLK